MLRSRVLAALLALLAFDTGLGCATAAMDVCVAALVESRSAVLETSLTPRGTLRSATRADERYRILFE